MRFPYEEPDEILVLMDRAGIDRAVLTSLNSVFYYDYEKGNREVGDAYRQYPDRFIPFVVINPNFVNWQDHLQECMDTYEVQGIKLHPDYHKYSLSQPMAAEVMVEAQNRGLPVYIQMSLLDMRHHPGYCFVEETPFLEVAEIIQAYPKITFIVGGAKHFGSILQKLLKYASGSTNFYVVTDGIGGPFDGLERVVAQMGSSRLLFGTRTPILYAEAATDALSQASIASDAKTAIFGQNAGQLLSRMV